MQLTQLWVDHFIKEEGYRRTSYKDHLGNWTIGVGHLLGKDPKFKGITWTDEMIIETLQNDVAKAVAGARELFPEFDIMSSPLQLAVTDMTFNMGLAGFRGFKRTIRLIHEGRFGEAADGALQSLWAKQVPNRARRVTDLIRWGCWTGEFAQAQ